MRNDIEMLAALRVAETGLTPAELLALPMDEYARATGRPTPTQAALRALDAQQPPQAPQEAPEAPQAPETQPQGIDVNSDEYFLAWRSQRVSGGEGRGIFDSVSSRSAEYLGAARAQSGRTAYSQGNVVEPPKLTGRYVQDDMRDPRTAAERFSNPSNLFQL
jgi:hypothetical protein